MVRILRIDTMVSGPNPPSANLSLSTLNVGESLAPCNSRRRVMRLGHIERKDPDTAR